MVAIVTGSGLGLERGSGFVLGSNGALGDASVGRLGSAVTVNAATGNLVIQNQDEVLIGQGPDSVLSRSYNSLGLLNDDNGDNWRASAQRSVVLVSGTVNTAGSTVKRIDWDGSEVIFTWDAGRSAYISRDGTGAYDIITFASNVWTWTDGASQTVEKYDNLNGGRITSTADTDGNQLTYTYTSGQLTRVTTASGDYTDLTWTGSNLTQLITRTSGGTIIAARTRYAYDTSNRLVTVTTDLSPADNSISDGKVVTTSYTYDGTSRRVASISESGSGNFVSFTYAQVGTSPDYRIATVTEAMFSGSLRTTSFSYDTVNRRTTVTDPLGKATVLAYDVNGNLTSATYPPATVGATAQVVQYAYNGSGDVTSVTDAMGKVTAYTYDTNGNLTLERDAAGNTVERIYGTKNQLLNETHFLVPDPDGAGALQPGGAVTRRYAYDAENHLRFAVDEDGLVTEYRYNTPGQLVSTIKYTANKYDLTGLSKTTTVSEATLAAWVTAISDRSTVQRTDTTYDFRGNVATVTEYSAADSAGNGLTSATYTRTTYTYDQFGMLLSRYVSGQARTEYFTYDGLGRMLTATDLALGVTSTVYNDAGRTATTTLPNGMVKTSVFTAQGELWTYAESGSGVATETESYKYDKLGRLRSMTDALGKRDFIFYDDAGRQTGAMDPRGILTEYRYDAANRLIATVRYANAMSTAAINSLFDASGNPTTATVASVRPATTNYDRWEWNIYDNADRVVEKIITVRGAWEGQSGAVTTYAYDGTGQLVKTTQYANVLAPSTVAGFMASPPTAVTLPTANAASDRVTRSFYANDGLLIGELDGDGALKQFSYDKAGRLVTTTAYANLAAANLRATGDFTALLGSVGTSTSDRVEYLVYDGQGHVRYRLDGNRRPTEYVYDAAGRVLRTIDYGASIGSSSGYSLSYVQGQITSLNLVANAATRMTRAVYDDAGDKKFEINTEGYVSEFGINIMDQITSVTRYLTKYSASDNPTFNAISSWASANNNSVSDRYFYDSFGRLVYEGDAEGYITEHQYDLNDRVIKDIRYPAQYTIAWGATVSDVASQIGALPAGAVVKTYAYDASGNVVDSWDGLNNRTHYDYTAFNQAWQITEAYGTADAAVTSFIFDTAGRMVNKSTAVGTPEQTNTGYAYDGLGNLTSEVDARNNTTTYSYDAVGNMLTRTVPLDASTNALTSYQYNAFGNVVKVTDPRGNASYNYYDKLDRLTLAIDAEGYATQTTYTIGNEIASTKRYYLRASNTGSVSTVPTLNTHALDATTSFTRDKLGRTTKVTDAEGYYEQYTLNALGDRVSVRNKLGGITTNVFDKRGLLIQETLPVGSTRSDGTVQSANIVNKFEYDARGNRTKMIEAFGLSEQRTTTYAYDKNDRLVSKTGDVQLVTHSDVWQTSAAPVDSYQYDGRGNLILTTDPAGAKTYAYYDDNDRKIAEINPVGTLSTWTYDANGNVTAAETSAANRIAYSKFEGGTAGWQLAYNPSGIVNAGSPYTTVWNGKNLIKAEATATSANQVFSVGTGVADRFAVIPGERLSIQAGVESQGTVGTLTLGVHWFAADGSYIGSSTIGTLSGNQSFDTKIKNFVTVPAGAVKGMMELYGTSTGSGWGAISLTEPMVSTANASQSQHLTFVAGSTTGALQETKRTTSFTYDKANRLVTTSQTGLRFGWPDSPYTTIASGTVTTTNYYDAAGNIIRQLGGNTASIYSYYDKLGRKIAQVDQGNYLTSWQLDAEGNALSETRLATPYGTTPVAGGTPPTVASDAANDRTTSFTYDRNGRRLTETRQAVISSTIGTNGALHSVTNEATIYYTYNGLGLVTSKTEANGGVTDWLLGYNPNGIATNSTPLEGVWAGKDYSKISFSSTAANQVVSIAADYAGPLNFNSGDQLSVSVGLEGQGPVSRQDVVVHYWDKTGNYLGGYSVGSLNGNQAFDTRLSGLIAIPAGAAKVRVEIYLYTSGAGAGSVVMSEPRLTVRTPSLATLAAFGDRTTYAYDQMGRLTATRGPSFVDHTGATVQPSTDTYYDGLNNVTRTREGDLNASANDHVTTFAYYAGNGRLYTSTDANGQTQGYYYDEAGRLTLNTYARQFSNGSARWEARSINYDLAGRVIEQTTRRINDAGTTWIQDGDITRFAYTTAGEVAMRGVNGQWQEQFSYDAGGRVWRSTAGDGVVKLYIYGGDGQPSLVISSSGAALPAGYSWSTITLDQAVALLTNNGAAAIGTVAVPGMVVTINVYDGRGQLVSTREPLRETTAIGSSLATIVHNKAYNAFGEVVSETDARGNTTNFSYNTMGRLIQKLSPNVNWTAENGAISTSRPQEDYYYDPSGRLVGIRDANGNLKTRTLLAGSGHGGEEAEVLKEFHPDGGVLENRYDVFGNVRLAINEVGSTQTFIYDKMDRLTQLKHQQRSDGTQLDDFYGYDSLGQRIWHYNSALNSGVQETTDYDIQGRVTKQVAFGGDTTTYGYMWSSGIVTNGLGTFGGWVKDTNVSGQGNTLRERMDYFGRLVDKVDYGNHDFDYTYDLAGRLSQRTNNLGQAISYSYYNTGAMASQTSGYSTPDFGSTITSAYRYDVDGNRTFESYVANTTYTDWYSGAPYSFNTSHQSATVSWDAMNRMTSFVDSGASGSAPTSVAWEYDKVGNIRHMAATFRYMDQQGNIAGTDSSQDYWYKYDSMNRFVTTKGVFNGARGSGSITRGFQGMDVSYDAAGRRASVTTSVDASYWVDLYPWGGYWVYGYQEKKENYSYTADGYLAQVNTALGEISEDPGSIPAASGTGALTASYARDAMGRVTNYTEYTSSGSLAYSRAAAYNAKSQVTNDVVTSVRTDGTWVSGTTYYFDSNGNGSGAYMGGVVTKAVTSVTKNGVGQTGNSTTNTFEWWDNALQKTTNYVSGSTNNTSTFYYDEGGHLQSVYIQDGRPRSVTFITDANGQILQRDEADNNASNGDPRELHYYFNGIKVGDVSNNGTSDLDYAASIAQHQAVPGNYAFRNGWGTGYNYADFDQSYDPINGLNYESSAGRYTVQAGDTLESIAQAVWGDASFWYMIAEANGLSGADSIQAGQSLLIPNKVHNSHNNSSTWKVYDPNEAIGDTAPTAVKPPKKSGGCGGIGMILMVVVAVAVAALVGPAIIGAPAAMGSTSATILGTMTTIPTFTAATGLTAALGAVGGAAVGGALAAAAGSIVSQGVGLAIGAQDRFSWKGVALSALTGGVSGGLGASGLLKGASPLLQGAARGVAGSVITQGIALAAGLQSKFDWAGVASAGVGGGIGKWVGGGQTVSGMAGGLAASAAQSLVTGRDFGDTIMGNLPSIIGSTIGNLAADQVAARGAPKTGSKSEERGAVNAKGDIIVNQEALSLNLPSLLDTSLNARDLSLNEMAALAGAGSSSSSLSWPDVSAGILSGAIPVANAATLDGGRAYLSARAVKPGQLVPMGRDGVTFSIPAAGDASWLSDSIVTGAVRTELPAGGVGFTTYNREGNDQFGTQGTINRIVNLGKIWADGHDSLIAIGDISHKDGGSFRPDHTAHLYGTHVDVRPFRIDNSMGPLTWKSDIYDRNATIDFIKTVKSTYPGTKVLFNDPHIISSGLSVRAPGHDNHLHIQFYNIGRK
jgi:YD repeat-containing protein